MEFVSRGLLLWLLLWLLLFSEHSRVLVIPRLSRNIEILTNITTVWGTLDSGTIKLQIRDRRRNKYEFIFNNEDNLIVKGAKFSFNKNNSSMNLTSRGPNLAELIITVSLKGNQIKSQISLNKYFSSCMRHRQQLIQVLKWMWNILIWFQNWIQWVLVGMFGSWEVLDLALQAVEEGKDREQSLVRILSKIFWYQEDFVHCQINQY